MNTDPYLEWTVRIIDPLKTQPIADAKGRTPEQALNYLRKHSQWKADSAAKDFERIKEALSIVNE